MTPRVWAAAPILLPKSRRVAPKPDASAPRQGGRISAQTPGDWGGQPFRRPGKQEVAGSIPVGSIVGSAWQFRAGRPFGWARLLWGGRPLVDRPYGALFRVVCSGQRLARAVNDLAEELSLRVDQPLCHLEG